MSRWAEVYAELQATASGAAGGLSDALDRLQLAYEEDRQAGLVGATTPISVLPYPLATDPVAQGASAIQALANALDLNLFTAANSAAAGADSAVGTYTVTGWTSGAIANWYSLATDGVNLLQTGKYLCLVQGAISASVGPVNSINILLNGASYPGVTFVGSGGQTMRGMALLPFALTQNPPAKIGMQWVTSQVARWQGGTIRIARL